MNNKLVIDFYAVKWNQIKKSSDNHRRLYRLDLVVEAFIMLLELAQLEHDLFAFLVAILELRL